MSTIKTTNIQHPSAASPAITLDAAGNLLMPGGKILQIVRATDSTNRVTSSTTYADVTGMSITITPQQSSSSIYIMAFFYGDGYSTSSLGQGGVTQITDSSNNPISGAEGMPLNLYNYALQVAAVGLGAPHFLLAVATPATTSAVTYKLRFKKAANSSTFTIRNADNTGQMLALEVSA